MAARRLSLSLLVPLMTAAVLSGSSDTVKKRPFVPRAPDGSCPAGTRRTCKLQGQAQYCLQEQFICDGTKHCLSGEDESVELCHRWRISTTRFHDDLYVSRPREEEERYCRLEHHNQPVCRCKYSTRLTCDRSGLTRIPRNVSRDVTDMYLNDNEISLHPGDLDSYTQLVTINLKGNGIKDIPRRFFANQGKLARVLLRSNQLTELPDDLFGSNVTNLQMDDNRLTEVPQAIRHLTQLIFLNLSSNDITLEGYEFPSCRLEILHLEDNRRIRSITNGTFRNLLSLKFLLLRNCQIETIAENAFHGLETLTELYLDGNRLKVLHRSWFMDMSQLMVLNLSSNGLQYLPEDGFHDLNSIFTLDLSNMTIVNLTKSMFSPLDSLSVIRFTWFTDCDSAPRAKNCEPSSDGISSLEFLLDTTAHQAMIWLIALLIVSGNLVVLWGRGFHRADENRNVSVLICNLAVADLLMGIYLFVLAFKNVEYYGEYAQHAQAWRFSPLCSISGVLVMTSSEVAVMIMTFMSVDSFLAIVYPMVRQRANSHMSRTVLCCMTFIWTCGITLALIPVFYWRNKEFYSNNGMCVPLHIQRSDNVGWEYSFFIFLGVNVFSLVLIIFSYVAMFLNIQQQTRRNTPLAVREVDVALRFFCIVATDSLCWTPIIVTKILALLGVGVPTALHAWIVVFVLPINSAINPFLYTFTTTKFYSRIKTVATKYSSCMPARRESVNNTGSESVAFTQRTSLQPLPAGVPGEKGRPASPSNPLLATHGGRVAETNC